MNDDALKIEGFGVLAHRALSANADVGLLLPCNVTMQEAGDEIEVAAVDPLKMLAAQEPDPAVQAVALDARARLERLISSLE